MEKKIKIICIYSDTSGVGHFRTIWPHQYIQEHYGDEFDIDIMGMNDIPKDNIINFLQQYDIFVFHKMLDRDCKLIDMVKFLNIPIVCDIDDAYNVGPDHPLYITSKREKWAEKITEHLSKSDYVTTTTELYAKKLQKYNKNVFILPNAIDPNSQQFIQTKKPSNRIRFGLVCGSAHLKDIELMNGISKINKDVMDKIQFVLCGFDTRGYISYYNKSTNKVERREIRPYESVWARYEEFLTNNYAIVSEEHKKYLKMFVESEDPFTDEPYRRFWTKHINNYALHYENVDVLLAPLKENEFNFVKSPLKVSECAFTDTALIATDFGPYTIDLKPYIEKGGVINPEGNALLVDPSKNHKQWIKYITYIANNPECIDIMKNNLKRDVYEKYSIENVTKDRVNLYRSIYYNKNKEN